MTSKEMISILEDLPEDIQIGRVNLTVKKLEDFRRLILLYNAEVQIDFFKFPDTARLDDIVCWFYTEDKLLQFRWEGSVNGYTVCWCEQDGSLQKESFRRLKDAQIHLGGLLIEHYDGVLLLPGTEQD